MCARERLNDLDSRESYFVLTTPSIRHNDVINYLSFLSLYDNKKKRNDGGCFSFFCNIASAGSSFFCWIYAADLVSQYNISIYA